MKATDDGEVAEAAAIPMLDELRGHIPVVYVALTLANPDIVETTREQVQTCQSSSP